MRRRLLLTAALVLAVLLPAAPASAITNGVADGGGHPNVGGLVAPTQYSDGTWTYCSGTLISPSGVPHRRPLRRGRPAVRVTFDPGYVAGDRSTPARSTPTPRTQVPRAMPTTSPSSCSTSRSRASPRPAARGRSLSGLVSSTQQFTSVGYGAYEVTNQPGGHQYLYDDVRMVATGTLNSINKTWLRISMNPSTGNGGTCYGDSGGPNFLGTTHIVAATTITGDSVCRSTNVDYRLDTPSARAFLKQYVALP